MCRYKKYGGTAKGKYREYKRRGKKKEMKFTLTFEDVYKLLSSKCHYCLIQPKKFQGIDRRDNEKGYTKANCVGCCSDCNYAKRTMSEGDFKKYLGRVTLSQIRKRPALRRQVIELLKELT